MGIGEILNGFKGKALDLKDIELIKHTYELQEENNKQLKENNELLKEKVAQLEAQIVNLVTENTKFKKQTTKAPKRLPAPKLNDLSVCILQCLAKRDGNRVSENTISETCEKNPTKLRHALKELERGKFIVQSYDFRGYYSILHLGRGYLAKNGLLSE